MLNQYVPRFKNPSNLILLLKGAFAFLHDGHLDALSAGERDHGASSLTNNENVGKTSGKGVTLTVLEVDNVKRSGVLLLVDHDSDAANIGTTGDHAQVSDIELDVVDDLTRLDIKLDGIVNLDERVSETDSSTVVGNEVGDSLLLTSVEAVDTDGGLVTDGNLLDSAELVLSFIGVDLVEGETSLDVIHKSEVFVGLVNGDDVHESSRVVDVSSDLMVDLDVTSHNNHEDFTTGESVFKTVSEDQTEGETLSQFVGTGGRTRSPGSAELVEHPVFGSI